MSRNLTQSEGIAQILLAMEAHDRVAETPLFGGAQLSETIRDGVSASQYKEYVMKYLTHIYRFLNLPVTALFPGRSMEQVKKYLTRLYWFLNLPITALFSRRIIMKLAEVCTIAKSKKINPGKLSKTQLIKMIQAGEGNYDCFATANTGECNQGGCSWRDDCFDAARKGAPS